MKRLDRVLLVALVGLNLSGLPANAAAVFPYIQTNLVSNLVLPGVIQDTNLQNPWGVSESLTTPLWISDQAANVATLYRVHGLTATPAGGPLVVPIPPSATPQWATGQVNNNTASFVITQTGTPTAPHFIFADLDGGIYAWAAAPNPAQLQPSTVIPGVVYTGPAIGGTTSAPFLYAANGGTNPGIEVFNGSFVNVTNTTFAGKFVDPNLPANYVPFNVQNIGGEIYVTYDRRGSYTADHGDGWTGICRHLRYERQPGETADQWQRPRLAVGDRLAPADFGPFSGDLLVGNFSYIDGQINAYDPMTGAFEGTLDSNAAWQGLWALTSGSGGNVAIPTFCTSRRA